MLPVLSRSPAVLEPGLERTTRMEYHVLKASSVIAFPCCLRAKARAHNLCSYLFRNMAQTIFRE
jgi:hypothetical protein